MLVTILSLRSLQKDCVINKASPVMKKTSSSSFQIYLGYLFPQRTFQNINWTERYFRKEICRDSTYLHNDPMKYFGLCLLYFDFTPFWLCATRGLKMIEWKCPSDKEHIDDRFLYVCYRICCVCLDYIVSVYRYLYRIPVFWLFFLLIHVL